MGGVRRDISKRIAMSLAGIAGRLNAPAAGAKGERPSGSVLEPFAAHADAIRKIIIDVIIVSFLFVLLAVVAKEAFTHTIVIEPLRVPTSLSQKGYTGEVAARQLIDELNGLTSDVQSWHSPNAVSTMSPEQAVPKLEVPGSGISMTAIIYYLRELLGISDVQITGEILEQSRTANQPKYVLQVRMPKGGFRYASPDANESPAGLLKAAALPIMEELNPYIAGLAHLHKQKYDKAIRMAQLCFGSKAIDEEWCYNLRGAIERAQGRDDDADADYRLAVAHARRFSLAQYNLSLAPMKEGFYQEALKLSLASIVLDDNPRRRRLGYLNAGTALENMRLKRIAYRDDPETTLYLNLLFGQLNWAAIREPVVTVADLWRDPDLYGDVTGAQIVGLSNGDVPSPDTCIAMFARAVETDPAYPTAFYRLGRAQAIAGYYVSAEQTLAMALALYSEGFPAAEISNAHYYLGRVKAAQEQFDAAITQFKAATEVKRDSAWPLIFWAQTIMKSSEGKPDAASLETEGLEKLTQAAALAADDAGLLIEIGETLEQYKKLDDAMVYYRKVIALKKGFESRAQRDLDRVQALQLP